LNKLLEVVKKMSRTKLIPACFALAILLITAMVACTAAAPASPPAPPTTTPPATATPSGTKLSFTPAKYINDEYGFYALYPDTMKPRKLTSQWSLLDASDPATIPSIGVSIEDSGNVDQNTMTVYTALGGTKITKASEEATTLADGKTKATLTKWTWQIGSLPITTLTLTAEKGAKTIAFSYSNISSKMDEKAGKEILYTLTFTK
jgi:hypothetical protein